MLVLKILIAVVAALIIWRIGYVMVRALGTPPPPPLPDGEMRRVKITYRCSSCGMEIRTTKAATSDPEPPRHCMDEMDLVPEDEML